MIMNKESVGKNANKEERRRRREEKKTFSGWKLRLKMMIGSWANRKKRNIEIDVGTLLNYLYGFISSVVFLFFFIFVIPSLFCEWKLLWMAKSIRCFSYGPVNYNKRQQFLIKLVRQERRGIQINKIEGRKTMRTKQMREKNGKNAQIAETLLVQYNIYNYGSVYFVVGVL